MRIDSETREMLNRARELARKAQAEGLYRVAVGCLDSQGRPGFRVFTHDRHWRFVPVETPSEAE